MWVIFLEMLAALALLVFIVWWTMFLPPKDVPEQDKPHEHEGQSGGPDGGGQP